MAIAFDNTGSSFTDGATSLNVDITAASVGAWCYAFIQVGSLNQNGLSMTGWVELVDTQGSTLNHFALYRRLKQSGDTTFPVTWATSASASACWSSYTGLLAAYPEEGFRGNVHTASSASYATPNITPVDGTRWALCGFGARSTTSAETWTAPGSQTIRSQTVGTVSPWSPAGIADSNAAITQAQHGYTFTLSAIESRGGAVICLLIPSTAATPSFPAPDIRQQAVPRAANW